VLLDTHVGDLSARQVMACGPGGFVGQVSLVQVTLAGSGRTLTVPRGMPLLDALEAQGLKPAHGCRMGICNTCACGKRSGTTRDLHTGDAIAEPVSALKLCVHSAASDLVIDL